MYLCLMYICPDVSKSGGGDVPMSDVSKSAPSDRQLQSGAVYRSQDFVMFFNMSCEGLPGQ